jgi:hypothetical protein
MMVDAAITYDETGGFAEVNKGFTIAVENHIRRSSVCKFS